MSRRLTEAEVDARCEAYGQAIGSLTIGCWTQDAEESRQAAIVVRQLESMRDRFYRDFAPDNDPPRH